MGGKERQSGAGPSVCGRLPDEKGEISDREALLKERAIVSEVRMIKAEHLLPILEWAYGNKDFKNRAKDHWKGMWDFVPDEEKKKKWPDETKKTYDYLKSILKWASDKKTRGHLDPPPGLPRPDEKGEVDHIVPNWGNQNEVNEAIAELARYYYNKAKPQNITPLLALNKESYPLGVLTIRWKGDPYNPYVRVAGIETFIVNPRLQHRGIGKTLFATAVEHVF